jgi:tetratricopeptide (TPR) repeat protein
LLIFVVYSQTGESTALEKANLFLDMREYRPAIDYYLKGLKENPYQQDIRKDIAYSYFKLWEQTKLPSMYEKSIDYLEEELFMFPKNEDAMDLLFFILYKGKRKDKIFQCLREYNIEIKSENKSLNSGLRFFILGFCFKKRKNFEDAEKYFKKALCIGYNPVSSYTQLLDIYLSQNNLSEYKRTLKEAVQFHGVHPQFLFMEALRSYKNEEIYPSIQFLEEALKMKLNFYDALLNLGFINYNLKNFEIAKAYFKEALDISSENEKIKFYIQCCENPKPENCPEKLNPIKNFVDNPVIEYYYQLKNDKKYVLQNINNVAIDLLGRGRVLEAIIKLKKAVEIDPYSLEMNYNLALMYFNIKNYSEAEKYALMAVKGVLSSQEWNFELALKRGNDFLRAYDLLGNIYFRKGDLEQALLAFKKVIEIDPEDAIGHYNLGCVYFNMRDFKKAEEEFKKAIKYDKKEREKTAVKGSKSGLRIDVIVVKKGPSLMAYISLGDLYSQTGEIEKAIKYYHKALKIAPTEAYCYYRLGKLYMGLGDKEKAIKYLEKYLEYGKEKEKEVRKLIENLKGND